jgi:hypothetical protein
MRECWISRAQISGEIRTLGIAINALPPGAQYPKQNMICFRGCSANRAAFEVHRLPVKTYRSSAGVSKLFWHPSPLNGILQLSATSTVNTILLISYMLILSTFMSGSFGRFPTFISVSRAVLTCGCLAPCTRRPIQDARWNVKRYKYTKNGRSSVT